MTRLLAQAAETPEWLTLTTTILVVGTIYAFVNLAAYLRAGDWDSVVKNALSMAAGFGAALLLGAAEVTEGFTPLAGSPPLGDLGVWSLLLIGIAYGASASAAKNVLKGFDNSDTAKTAPIVRSADGPQE